MNKQLLKRLILVSLPLLLLVGYAGLSYAVEGAVLINNLTAKFGNITPGDAPGYPVTISKPGNYVLTGNLEGLGAIIEITSSLVTLDLNGFSINNTAAGGGAVIKATEGTMHVTVMNGNVLGGGSGGGVYLKRVSVIEKINLHAGDGGLSVGDYGRIRDCTFISSGPAGISAGDYSVVSNNILSQVGGIYVGKGSRVTGNEIGEGPLMAIKAGPNSIIEENVIAGASVGIKADSGCSVSRNTVSGTGTGIEANSGSKVTGNTVTGCGGFGLSLAADAGYSNNVLTGNNGGSPNPQVSGGIEMGANVCGTGTTCP
jgi:hypothetical protein